MGFPLARVVRACQSLGEDGQRIINFCLLADKVTESFKQAGEREVEHVLLLKSLNEEEARRHLGAFVRLKDFGFDSKAIHDALSECGGDHDKALEQLLK